MPHTLTTCTFCGVGCGIYLETEGGRITGAYPSLSHPSNAGRICVRGWHVHEVASSPDRVLRPLIRRGDRFEEASWTEAIDFIARRLLEIRDRHGPDALAFLNAPRCSNEESYLLQKVARALFGTNNVDHGGGVYCHNSIAVLRDMLGVTATTNTIGDLDQSEVLLVDGVDLGRQLPTIGGRVTRAKLRGARLIVIDARRHRVAELADWFLQPRPGTETALYGAMAKVLVDRGLVDQAFLRAQVRNWADFREVLDDYDLLSVAEECGVPAADIEAAAAAYGRSRRAAILYSTGIESRSEESIRGLVNLVLLTGNLGRPGAGLYALTEQNNLQGVCDMGMLPDYLPGYRPVVEAGARRELEQLWGVSLPSRPGCDTGGPLTANGHARVRGLWLCRYDPVSVAFFGEAAEALQRMDLVVAQHIFRTGTARYAHVILPVTAFGEEEVTFTSTDRRIQLARQAIPPPEGPVPVWQQLTWLGRRLGADWDYESSADVMREIARAVPSYSGANHENLGRDYGRHWPCTLDRPLGTPDLFEDGPDLDHHFHLAAVRRPAMEPVDPAYPFRLVFGHSLYYWNQNVLIRHSETLHREYRILLLDYPDGFVEINTEDARTLGIRDGQRVRLRSPGGSAAAAARVTPEVRRGAVFVPFFVREVERQLGGNGRAPGAAVPVRLDKEAAP